MKNLASNIWYYTPFCLFAAGSAINNNNGQTFTMPNRFLRPAYYRIIYSRQTRTPYLEILSPKEFEGQWKAQIINQLHKIDIEVLRSVFQKYSIGLSSFDSSVLAAAYIANRMYKDREHKSSNFVDVMLQTTPLTLADPESNTNHIAVESQIPAFIVSCIMGLPHSDPYVTRLVRELEAGELAYSELLAMENQNV